MVWKTLAIASTSICALLLLGIFVPRPTAPAQSDAQIVAPVVRSTVPPPPAAIQPTPFPRIGQIASNANWEVKVLDYGTFEHFTGRSPSNFQGKLVVLEFNARNLKHEAAHFSDGDFSVETQDRRVFKPTSHTATIDKGFFMGQGVQPGLTTLNRVVFDVDPQMREFILKMLGVQFFVADGFSPTTPPPQS